VVAKQLSIRGMTTSTNTSLEPFKSGLRLSNASDWELYESYSSGAAHSPGYNYLYNIREPVQVSV
jgi:hypothetical protein